MINFLIRKKVKSVTIKVIISKLIKSKSLICFLYTICEKIMDITDKSKYQNTPCPICGAPYKEKLKFWLKMLDIIPNIARRKGIKINGWSNFLISNWLKIILKAK